MASCFGALCCNADLHGLQSAASDCQRLSGETVYLCVSALDKCQRVIAFGNDMQSTISGFADITNTSPSSFMKVWDLIDESDHKLKEVMSLATEADDMALECANKSKEMAEAMNKGIDSLPDRVRVAIEDEVDDFDNEHVVERKLVDDLHRNIQDVQICTRGLEQMNLLTVADSGKDAFVGLSNKWELCSTVFEKIKASSTDITRITETIMTVSYTNKGLCAIYSQMKAIISESKDILRSISLSKLIAELAEAANKLIQSIQNLVKTALNRFQGFGDDLQAAKTINGFVSNQWMSFMVGGEQAEDRRMIPMQQDFKQEYYPMSLTSSPEEEKKEYMFTEDSGEFDAQLQNRCPLQMCMG